MHTGERWRLGRRPALDGLRGVAVLLVITYHVVGEGFAAGGIVGVTAFFVLSGFLITSLLLEERAETGRINLCAFYGRRARRLFPALALMLSIAVPLVLLTGTVTGGGVIAVVFYSANWWMLAGHNLGMLVHTWTLATEEQFYLLWPVALLALCRIRRPLVAVGVLALVPLLFLDSLSIVISGDALLAGCALALWMHGRPRLRTLPATVVPVCMVALVGACWIAAAPIWATLAATAVSVAVVYGIATDSPTHLLGSRIAQAVGKRSYGLYLWHMPIIWLDLRIGVSQGLDYWQSALLSLPVLFGVVELSWHYVETPIMQARPQRVEVAAVPVEAL